MNMDANLNNLPGQALQSAASGESMLPAESYTDKDFYKLELDRFFRSSWMAIGFASELADPVQAVPYEVLDTPLLVTRDQDNDLHVFANVCRHRGHILAENSCKGRRLLTCPYHAWSYALDGRFVKAPFWDGTEGSAPDVEQKTHMGLVPIPFAVWYDIIFVNLSGDAVPFASHIEAIQQRWEQARPPCRLRRFSEKHFGIDGNWKLAAENFLDNYHLPWIHPEIGSSTEATLGLEAQNLRLAPHILGFSHLTAGKDKSKTEIPLPGWPDMQPELEMQQDLLFIFPNTCLVMEGNYLWSMLLLPKGPNQCDEKMALYVVDDQGMSDHYAQSRQQLANTIYRINEQDVAVIQKLQKGRASDAASAGIFNPRHDQLGQWFHQHVASTLSANETVSIPDQHEEA